MNHSTRPAAIIAPSLLSADYTQLAAELLAVQKAGADWIHLDIMDGHFVPSLTFGPLLVQAIRKMTSLPLDCHLMVTEPERWIEPFVAAGADWITIHCEATHHLNRVLQQIRHAKCRAGVALNPATPLTSIEEVLDQVDLVLIMSVNPGFGGQSFIETSKKKIERLKALRGHRSFLISVDGGVQANNIGELHRLGSDVFVAGSAIFSSPDKRSAIAKLRSAL